MNRQKDRDEMRRMLDPGPVPACVDERLAAAYAQLRSLPQASENSAPPVRRAHRLLRTAAVAAALCAALSVTALAASGQLAVMAQGVIEFFAGDEDSSLASMQPALEAYTAEVGVSVTDEGVTFTVDSVSADENFINLFGTVHMDGLADALRETGDSRRQSDAWALTRMGLYPMAQIDGALYGTQNTLSDTMNAYFINEDTVGWARRIVLDGTLPAQYAMQVLPSCASQPDGSGGARLVQKLMGREGDWTVEVEVDLGAAASAARTAAAQTLEFGGKKLDLVRLSVSPLGAVAVVDDHDGGGGIQSPQLPVGPQDGYTQLQNYALRDSTGRWLYVLHPAAYSGGRQTYELTSPDAQADGVTFIPLTLEEAQSGEGTAALREGERLEMNAQSGYTVVSYTAEETRVSLTLMPYGPGCPSLALDLQLCDASGAALGDGAHASIVTTRTSDHYTGEITVEIDCAAGEADFTQAAGLRFVRWPEMTLDEAAAVTVALP